MMIFGMLHHRLLLLLLVMAGACLCVYGTPVGLPRWVPLETGPQQGRDVVAMSGYVTWVHVTDPSEDEGSAGGGGGGDGGGSDGPDAHRARPEERRGERNGDIFRGGRSGPGLVDGRGREAVHERERREVVPAAVAAEVEETMLSLSEPPENPKGQRPTPETALSVYQESPTSVVADTKGNATLSTLTSPDDDGQSTGEASVNNTPRSAVLVGHPAFVSTSASTEAPPPLPLADSHTQRSAAWEEEAGALEWLPASQEPPGAGGEPALGQSPPVSFVSPSPGTPPFPALSEWGQEDGVRAPFVPDLLLAEVAPDMMSKPEGPEALWSEAVREDLVVTDVPGLSQDTSTERTMSSEDLPLIFDPFDDVTLQGVTTVSPGFTTAAAAVPDSPPRPPPVAGTATGDTFPDRLVTAETDGGGEGGSPSRPPPLLPEGTLPWQVSGTPEPEPNVRASIPQATKDSDKAEKREETSVISGLPTPTPLLLLLACGTPVTTATHRHVFKSTSGLEEMESEEEGDEDEEDENTEDSDEEDSDEDEQADTLAAHSHIPAPVWVQHNQGLMRSWMELIREKAGYVSGMLAPVGIGIAGAILIVGILYSFRMLHHRRRNSFKYQRRKVRQQEQPRESGPSRPDQAMLLADSSEDEF